MSKLSTLIGILLGTAILLINIVNLETGEFLSVFLNWKALLVVVGGTFAAAFINYPLSQMVCFFKGFVKVFFDEPVSEAYSVEQLLNLSKTAHASGLLEIEKKLDTIEDPFLQYSLSELLVYREEEYLFESLNNHLNAMKQRHINCQDVFNNMATYAPAFGMLGTVMGLILMMTNQIGVESVDSINQSQDMLGSLLAGMGLALVTTFYGVLIANLIFSPMAGKLRVLSDAEIAKNKMIIQGVMAIKKQMSTSFLREYLLANMSYKDKLSYELSI